MTNVVALRGHLSRPAELRSLPSGSTLVGLEVTTRRASATKAETVPVVWHDAPPKASAWDAGEEVVVVGHVSRRFFRAGGGTQSRTEVVATMVLPIGQKKRITAALRDAARSVEGTLDPSPR